MLIAGGETSVERLASALAQDLGRGVDDEMMRATRDAIAALDGAGLVSPAS